MKSWKNMKFTCHFCLRFTASSEENRNCQWIIRFAIQDKRSCTILATLQCSWLLFAKCNPFMGSEGWIVHLLGKSIRCVIRELIKFAVKVSNDSNISYPSLFAIVFSQNNRNWTQFHNQEQEPQFLLFFKSTYVHRENNCTYVVFKVSGK